MWCGWVKVSEKRSVSDVSGRDVLGEFGDSRRNRYVFWLLLWSQNRKIPVTVVLSEKSE